MELNEILALYDEDQRRNIVNQGMRREVAGPVVRHVALHEQRSHINYSRLDDATADEAIRAQQDYFGRLGHSFEWAAFSHDSPPDLRDRLLRHGFESEEAETIVVLELESTTPTLRQTITHDVRRIRDVAKLPDAIAVNDMVWGANDQHIAARLRREFQEMPERLSVYVAFAEGVPACSGWIRFNPSSPFASLWGGSTLPHFRKRGLYTALVAARAQEALQRGARFLTVDARSQSRPILEKLNFRVLTRATPMIWKGNPPLSTENSVG